MTTSNTEAPDVSVIICVRNGEATLRRQLDALDVQQGEATFEILVIDNGSTDSTADLAREWIEEPEHAHVAARLVDGGTEPGIPRVRNLGASLARGRVLAFCDADDVVEPQWVSAFATAIDGDQLAGGRIIACSEKGEPRPDIFGEGLVATPYRPHVGNCNCAISRNLFFAVGGYDESLPRYGFEDVDLSWRVQEAGFPLIYVPGARVRFTVSGNRASIRKRYLLGKGRVVMAKRFPAYDSTQYTLTSTLRGVADDALALLRSVPRDRPAAKGAASRLVAGLGRVTAVAQYRIQGFPSRRLVLDEKHASARGASQRRIAIATNNGDIGGGEVMLLSIASALQELGLEVHVLAPTSPGGLLEEARSRGVATVPLHASHRAGYMLALARWRLRHLGIPLWCNGLVPTVATTAMGPRLAHLHILPTGVNALAARIGRMGARRVLAPSPYLASIIPGTTVLENWTEDIAFRPRCPERSGPLRVGFLGRLTRDKGVHVLARAMRQVIASTESEIRLVLAGENRFGDVDDDREISAALAPIEDHVERWGWVQREEFFDQVDIAVFPSVWGEPFGLVVAEAMAGGVPFVITDAGALPDVAGPEHPWIARSGDAEDLARVIVEAVTTEQPARDLVIEGSRQRWEQNYSTAAGRRRVASLLQGLAQDDRKETR
ncbi:glycosyl transferase family 1 [Brachybacterium muris UCD-AY4]|uniref:Glycosyl transferase family 1 n=1 Tax=Brachybacterium muris UCD-AY4 TaxID=1249481 RepID=A0A022KW96_9MICO|nr:glycosyl transferase family 1 [Brachybacterium muris UCD-AY4]